MHICMLQDQNCVNIFTRFLNLSEYFGSEAKRFEGTQDNFLMFVLCEGMIMKVLQRKKKKNSKGEKKSRELNEVTEPHMS